MFRTLMLCLLCLIAAARGFGVVCPDSHGGSGTASISGADPVGPPGSPYYDPNGAFTFSSFVTSQGASITCGWTFDSNPPGNWINLYYNHGTGQWTYYFAWGSAWATGPANIDFSGGTVNGTAGPMVGQGGALGHNFGTITFGIGPGPCPDDTCHTASSSGNGGSAAGASSGTPSTSPASSVRYSNDEVVLSADDLNSGGFGGGGGMARSYSNRQIKGVNLVGSGWHVPQLGEIKQYGSTRVLIARNGTGQASPWPPLLDLAEGQYKP